MADQVHTGKGTAMDEIDLEHHLPKIDRAERLGAELADSIQAWFSGKPWDLDARIADDRLSWRLILKVRSQPPLDKEWGLIFGEVVHNLRSSLDNFSVSLAVASGVSDVKELRKVQFPVSATRRSWRDDSKRIASLDQQYRQGIESVQPFQRGNNPKDIGGDLLLLLRELSNQDKHHLQMRAVLETASMENQAAVEFETEEGAAASLPPDTEVSQGSFVDDEALLISRTKGRIAKVKGRFDIALQAQVVLPDGRRLGITESIAALCLYTRQVMQHVAASK